MSSTLDRLEALLAAHGTNPMGFVGELNALGIAALPALVRLARATEAWAAEKPDGRWSGVDADLVEALLALDAVKP